MSFSLLNQTLLSVETTLAKALFLDGVPNILLKKIPRKATVFLIYIYNSCLKLCYFPKKWKHTVVIPIPNPGKAPSKPSGYRPISLLSSIHSEKKVIGTIISIN
jgi:hypothetical protein